MLSVENGAEWIHPFIEHLAHTYKMMPQAFEENPVDAFKRCVYLSPFHEDDFTRLIDVMGVDHLCFGSDFPHPEGLAEPTSFVDHLPADLPKDDVAAIMGGNLGRLMKVGVGVS